MNLSRREGRKSVEKDMENLQGPHPCWFALDCLKNRQSLEVNLMLAALCAATGAKPRQAAMSAAATAGRGGWEARKPPTRAKQETPAP